MVAIGGADNLVRCRQVALVVALAGADSAAQFIAALAQALAFIVQPQSPPEEQLFNHLGNKELLLLLDNFEQLINTASVAFVTELLQRAPDVKLLIPSRVRLNVQGEQLYWLQGLHFPAAQVNPEALTLTDLNQYSGLQLFIETARRVQAPSLPTTEDASAIVTICQLVQGMPLAIELAAAWTHVLSLAKIVTEMSRTLDFLASELQDLPLRQRSMRAVFDTSWRRRAAMRLKRVVGRSFQQPPRGPPSASRIAPKKVKFCVTRLILIFIRRLQQKIGLRNQCLAIIVRTFPLQTPLSLKSLVANQEGLGFIARADDNWLVAFGGGFDQRRKLAAC